jgi:hypothetical protein
MPEISKSNFPKKDPAPSQTPTARTERDFFRQQLQNISERWRRSGLPSTQTLEAVARQLEEDQKKGGFEGLWPHRPLMVTATLDDGLGQGLAIIQRFAVVAGLQVQPLGLMQTPERIITACGQLNPYILGLTVLQLDTEDQLAQIGRHLPPRTRFIAGGPVFRFDPDMAVRCGIDFVAPSLTHFIDFLCRLEVDRD